MSSSISTALLETETTLALPMKPLCRGGLPGPLPDAAAATATRTACACETPAPDPRWAALKGLADRLSK